MHLWVTAARKVVLMEDRTRRELREFRHQIGALLIIVGWIGVLIVGVRGNLEDVIGPIVAFGGAWLLLSDRSK